MTDAGHAAVAVGVDVTRRDTVENMVKAALARFGGLHILINSAGITRRNVSPDADFEELARANGSCPSRGIGTYHER